MTTNSAQITSGTRYIGAIAAINYRTEDFVERIATLTADRGVDVILDMIGGDYLLRNLECMAV